MSGLSHRLGAAAAGGLGPPLLKLSGSLTRVRFLGREHERDLLRRHGSVIYATWHGRFWLLVSRLRYTRSSLLISLSKDGELIARCARGLGYRPVRGSSSRRGSEGLRELEAELAAGHSVALTPDGPRGPRHEAQPGTVVLAARSGRPILPVAAASRSAWRLRSWDRFEIPRPGTRAVIVFGEPILVPREEDLEPWRARLETALNDLEARADREVAT